MDSLSFVFNLFLENMEGKKIMMPKTLIRHKNAHHTCDMCKLDFEADHVIPRNSYLAPLYNGSTLAIRVRKDNQQKIIALDMCPECTEKLLELLDKHFPRLNLEDEL